MSVTGAGVGSLLACVSEAEVTTAVWVGLLWFGSVVVGIGLLLAGLCSSAPPSERAGRDVAIANVVAAVLLGGWATSRGASFHEWSAFAAFGLALAAALGLPKLRKPAGDSLTIGPVGPPPAQVASARVRRRPRREPPPRRHTRRVSR